MKLVGDTKNKALAGALLGAMTLASLSAAQPAGAFTWDENSVTFGLSDVNSTVEVFYFKGYIEGMLTEGLTSELSLLLKSFDGLTAEIEGTVTNTMTGFTDGRVTGIAFNVDPDVETATSGGVFTNPEPHLGKNFLNQGKVDICYGSNLKNCNGNKNGVGLGQSGTFYTTLTWEDYTSSFTLSDFFARYQGLDSDVFDDASGYGVGTVPTPALIPSLLGMALAARRRKDKESKVSEQVA